MTERTKTILNGLDENGLKKQFSITTDAEVKEYIEARLDSLHVGDALVEGTEIKQGEFFQ